MDRKVESDLLYAGRFASLFYKIAFGSEGGLDWTREAAAGCIGHSKGIRRVAELVQQHDLAKKLVLHKVMLKPSILFIDVVIKELPASSTSPIPFWIIIFA